MASWCFIAFFLSAFQISVGFDEDDGKIKAAACYLKGTQRYLDGDYREALALFEMGADSHCRDKLVNARIAEGRGKCLYKLGEYRESIKAFTVVLELDSACERAFAWRGDAFFRMRQFKDAYKEYTIAIRIDPANKRAVFNRAMASIKSGEHERAASDFSRLLRENAGDAEMLYWRAYCRFHAGYHRCALRDVNAAISISPLDADNHELRAKVLREMGKSEPYLDGI